METIFWKKINHLEHIQDLTGQDDIKMHKSTILLEWTDGLGNLNKFFIPNSYDDVQKIWQAHAQYPAVLQVCEQVQ